VRVAAVSDLGTLVRVSRLYYELGETQDAIARLVGVTRPQVSRLLKEARAQGVVEIRIVDQGEPGSEAGDALRELFKLRAVHLAPTVDGPAELTRRRVGRLAGHVLREALRDGMVVGVGDGAALAAMADAMEPGPQLDVSVVPLCGGFWRPTAGADPARRIADALGASAYALHAPGLLDEPAVRAALLAHPGVRSVTELWGRLDAAILGIGGPTWSEATIGPRAMAELAAAGAVGEVLIAPFDIHGRLVGDQLRERTIAFDPRGLPGVATTIGVAEGESKVAPILGALRGRFVNVLVTDVATAEAVAALADGKTLVSGRPA
jgi:DNA-binding transcriptional regulator LsrR (DeoR family)